MEPRGTNGWSSPILEFGDEVTSLFAANGSGKTPLIQSLVYCLGYPVTFRNDIIEKCASIRLHINIKNSKYSIVRLIDKEFYITVEKTDEPALIFTNELDYSKYIFQLLNLNIPKLVSLSKQPVEPYLATVLPVFYLDQDYGYSSLYKPPSNFIKDQFCEVVRFILNLGPRNSYDAKKDILKLQDALQIKDHKIVLVSKTLTQLNTEIANKDLGLKDYENKINQLKNDLEELKSNENLQGGIDSVIQNLIHDKQKIINDNNKTILELSTRIDGIEKIKSEISSEVDTLGLNEESKRVFESFKDICANKNCGLFMGSSETYAKNLLYLKDQIKDLERNADLASNRVELLKQLNVSTLSEINSLTLQKNKTTQQSDISNLIETIGRVTSEIFDLEQSRQKLEIFKNQQSIFQTFTKEREDLLNRINNMKSTSNAVDIEFLNVRMKLKELIVKWLDTLKTHNVSHNIIIESDLKMTFGGESLESIKGSTKTRLILAIHAAIYEYYISANNNSFNLLVLDTPRQHEVHEEDILNYLSELKKIASKHSGQIILSSTSFRYIGDKNDNEWIPTNLINEDLMYLGQ